MYPEPYPARLTIAYPEDGLNRLSTLLRVFLLIPGTFVEIMLILFVIVSLPIRVVIVIITGRYPRRLFDLQVEAMRFMWKRAAYLCLLTDKWEFDTADHPVEVAVSYPQQDGRMSRWLPLIKWLLALPHLLILQVFWIAAVLLLPILWVHILLTGRMARGLFKFYAYLLKWNFCVAAYCQLLADRYPPFGE